MVIMMVMFTVRADLEVSQEHIRILVDISVFDRFIVRIVVLITVHFVRHVVALADEALESLRFARSRTAVNVRFRAVELN